MYTNGFNALFKSPVDLSISCGGVTSRQKYPSATVAKKYTGNNNEHSVFGPIKFLFVEPGRHSSYCILMSMRCLVLVAHVELDGLIIAAYVEPVDLVLVAHEEPVGLVLVAHEEPVGLELVAHFKPEGLVLVAHFKPEGLVLVVLFKPVGL